MHGQGRKRPTVAEHPEEPSDAHRPADDVEREKRAVAAQAETGARPPEIAGAARSLPPPVRAHVDHPPRRPGRASGRGEP
ncbi:MAG TPA: hypothetical protein VM681_08585 [Candidatus Thermoplasmatota archaeon]|nr:hypothetical protein [Candidatus Thermoplasmatota archaeon]